MSIACSRRRVFLLGLLLLVAAFLPAVRLIPPLLPRKIDLEPEVRRAEYADVSRLAARNRNKVLLLAVDGTSWNVLDPLLESGELPHIAALIAGGTHGRLKSLKVMKSPVIWTTMLTGCMPEKHGITDFLIEGKPPRSYQRKTPALWNMLGEAKSSASIGFWATWPPEPVNGFMISDYVGMRSEEDETEEFRRMAESLTHPPGLMEEIAREGDLRDKQVCIGEFYDKFTRGPVSEEEGRELFGSWLDTYALIYQQDIMFKDIARYLVARYHPDLTGVYFRGIDSVQHLFWAYREPERFEAIPPAAVERYGDIIDNYYRLQDEWIGELCALVDRDTTVILVSDHGFKAKPLERYRKDRDSLWYHLSGDHDTYGVIIMSGPPIKKGCTLLEARVEDIAPTVLYLMGFPVSDDMDGKVLTSAFTPSYKYSHPLYTIAQYPRERREAQEAVGSLDDDARKRLKALGYIQ